MRKFFAIFIVCVISFSGLIYAQTSTNHNSARSNKTYPYQEKANKNQSDTVKIDEGIRFVGKADFKKLPCATSEMFQLKEVQKLQEKFVKEIYKDKTPPKVMINNKHQVKAPNGYKFAALSICGRRGYMLVPESLQLSSGEPVTYVVKCDCDAPKPGASNARCFLEGAGTCVFYCKPDDNCMGCKGE